MQCIHKNEIPPFNVRENNISPRIYVACLKQHEAAPGPPFFGVQASATAADMILIAFVTRPAGQEEVEFPSRRPPPL
jgi:hypothetical protein